ncbi:MAG: PEP-CTERM sorting domain-containing protein [Desmonostoc vinosum HA7617-LM4]|jgi:hypothetical protein|nr:PEP-CTERM sorting domain-containing protein [Desmonostoc vinosum HA7617-LM4]
MLGFCHLNLQSKTYTKMIIKNLFRKIASTVATGAAFTMAIAFEVPQAQAVLLSISNAGFEDSVIGEEGFTINVLPGWELYDPSDIIPADPGATPVFGAYNPSADAFAGEAPEGNNVGYLYLTNPPGSGIVGITQTLTSILTADTKYTLEVEVGNIPPFGGFTTLAGFPGYVIQLLAGGTVIAEDFNSQSVAEGAFITSTLSYLASANDANLGKSLEIRLLSNLQSEGIEVDFDNVKLDATKVPEPTSILGLLALGAFAASSVSKLSKQC